MGMSVPQMSAFIVQPPHNENLRAVRDHYGNIDRSRLATAQDTANQRMEQQVEPSAAGHEALDKS